MIANLSKKINRICKPLLYEEILVLGDSHAGIFSNKKFNNVFKRKFFNVISVGGATVSGLENPNAATQAIPIFNGNIKKSRAKIVIVLLGEVDTGFVIWYRAEKYKTSVAKMLDMAVQNYIRFLHELSMRFRVICVSTPLPTIRDGQNWGEIANARKDVQATLKQRTDLTIYFNEIIEKFCKNKNIKFIALDNKSLGRDGIVKPELLNTNPKDHHYNPETYSELLIQELKNIIEPTGSPGLAGYRL